MGFNLSKFHRLSKRTGDALFLAKRVQIPADRRKGIPASSDWRYVQVYGHIQENDRGETFLNVATQTMETFSATAWVYPMNFPAHLTSDVFIYCNGVYFQVLKSSTVRENGMGIVHRLRLRETQESSRVNRGSE